ncbi:hypothetical protein BDV29DRAFT_49266 [Aspergillus leporis]|uniref:Uncharacterized protein n=1 Tax=Aspergillus leporis TaxID=41062 RepID=A0A5N5XA84_9EURO|nr:hypothetical protein BDV29DRAFT_49266 [Aspergillus leporis]
MEPPSRQCYLTPSSLLWAHEIRRENIHLTDQIHNAKANLTSTITTVNILKQDLGELTQQVKQADIDVSDRLNDIEIGIEGRLATLIGRIEILEHENRNLKHVLEDVGVRTNELSQVVASLKEDVMSEVRGMLAHERDTLRFHRRTQSVRIGSDVLVPDSMPTDDDVSPTQRRRDSLQALSETTWGPPSSLEGQHDSRNGQNTARRIGETDLKSSLSMKQQGRSLDDYWSYADKIGSRLPSWEKSSNVVKAFVNGLESSVTRGMIERRLDVAGWSWNALAGIMVNEESISQAAGLYGRTKADSGGEVKRNAKNIRLTKGKKKKRRRVIPIIPADEDELLDSVL